MRIKRIKGMALTDQLEAKKHDRMYTFLLANGNIRGVIMKGTIMVGEMRANHRLGVLETLVLGHAYIAAAMMSVQLKGEDRITLQVDCSGPIKGFVVESNAYNEVRGYLKNVPIPVEKPVEDFNMSPFFGAGFLTVTKTLEDRRQPFSGKVMLEYGNLARDLTNYYMISEQVPSAINLSVQFDNEGNVVGAGGMFLQVMPQAEEREVIELEEMVARFPSIGASFAEGIDPEDLVKDKFGTQSPEFLDHRKAQFYCQCKRERMMDYLAALPDEDLRDIIDKGPFPVEIRCHHCNTYYHIKESEIRDLFAKKIN